MHDDRCMAGPAGNCFAHQSARVLLPPLSQPRPEVITHHSVRAPPQSPAAPAERRRMHINGTGSGHRLTPAHRWCKKEHRLELVRVHGGGSGQRQATVLREGESGSVPRARRIAASASNVVSVRRERASVHLGAGSLLTGTRCLVHHM